MGICLNVWFNPLFVCIFTVIIFIFDSVDYQKYIYNLPNGRFVPFVIGMLLGFYLNEEEEEEDNNDPEEPIKWTLVRWLCYYSNKRIHSKLRRFKKKTFLKKNQEKLLEFKVRSRDNICGEEQ